ncbi:MAG: hypothetical protein ABSG73_13875 [Candidatus Aminicenantales bacterium]|jgi:hypothetical protein
MSARMIFGLVIVVVGFVLFLVLGPPKKNQFEPFELISGPRIRQRSAGEAGGL